MSKDLFFYRILIIILIGCLPISIFGQSLINYNVTRSTGISYNSIIPTGSSFASWRNTGSFTLDDNRSIATDIGFDFWYNGNRYTQFSISTNGFLDFSNSTDDGGPICDDYGYCNFNFTSSNVNTGTWLALAPFYDDMTTRDGVDPLGSSMKYQLSGTAPYRVLTVEWDALAVYQNTTPDINFQIKLYETTGVIEYLYETMNNGNKTFSYTVGLNAETISNPPTAAELLTQQTSNSASFSNSPQNNLSTMPEANSMLQFTPPTPSAPVGSLTFSGITNSGMTLNWTDWASNEVGYALYYSTDGTNYFYSAQTGSNASSAIVSNLSPNTTYYWKVFAFTEGALSTSLTGNASTLAPGIVTSVASARWDNPGTWDCNCIPSAGDNVIIKDGHTVTIRANSLTCNDLTIGEGTSGSLEFIRNTARDLSINGNLTVNSGAILDVRSNSNTTHTLNVRGNIINNGTINLQTDANSLCSVNFTRNDGSQLVSGSGTTVFYNFYLDNSLISNIVDIATYNFTCDPNGLNFTSGGTFKFSSAGTNSFSLSSVNLEIPSNGKVWITSANSTISFGSNIILSGDLTLDNGVLNIGDATDENIISNGGILEINGGILSVAGRYEPKTTESTSHYIQSGGSLLLPTIGSTSGVNAPFDMSIVGSALNVSGGVITVQQMGSSNLGYNTSGVTSFNISGGTLQIGNGSTPAAQTIQISSATPVGNLLLNSVNAYAMLTNDLSVLQNITLTSGTLDASSYNISLNGDWLANGGIFISSTSTVSCTGSNQSITTGGSAFNHLVLTGSGTKSIQDNLIVNGNLSIDNTTLSPVNSGFNATLGGNWTNNGSFVRNNETITLNGAVDQTISGSTATDFTNIIVSKSGGSVLNESTLNLFQTLDLQSATTFDADGSGLGVLRLISNATEESRVAPLPTGALIVGNVTAEKYLPSYGAKRWRNIGFTVKNATVADIQNEIPISGNFIGSDNGTGSIPSYATGSLAYYDNTIGDILQTMDDRWILYPTTDNSALLTSAGTEGRGYSIWIRELGAVTFDVTGTLNQGIINFQPTGLFEGWNLLGNPYPSAIDWDATGWTKLGIQGNAIYVWDGLQYRTWNGTIGDMGNGIIAKGQAFWVQASQTTMTLTSDETVKDINQGTTYREGNEPSYIELVVTDQTYTDKAYIYLSDGAKNEFDDQDASKLINYIFSLSSLSTDSVKLAINAITPEICNSVIPLTIDYIWAGTYSFQWNNLSSLPDYLELSIQDNFTNSTYDLRTENEFEFVVNDEVDSYDSYRFFLSISVKNTDTTLQSSIVQNCDNRTASVTLENSESNVLYTLFKNDSIQVDQTLSTGGPIDMYIDSIYLEPGNNTFKFLASAGTCRQDWLSSMETYIISKPEIAYDEENSSLSTSFQENLTWYRNDTIIEAQGDTLVYIDGHSAVYYVEVSNDICSKVSDVFQYVAPDPIIIEDGNLITSLTNNQQKEVRVRVFPNPFTDYFVIDISNMKEIPYSMELLDAKGKLVKNIDFNSTIVEVTIDHLNTGVYYLRLLSKNNVNSIILIKN